MRIPSLDGLRAVSIVAVLLGHLTGTAGFPRLLTPIIEGPYFDAAHMGVRVFFVISGFLITGILLRDPRLGPFYWRRTVRIVPAYLAYLATVGLLIPTGDLAHALTWTVNYEHGPSWLIGHLWSLAVEEQFYLLWPLTLYAAGRGRAGKIALLVVCVVPWIRLFALMDGQHVGTTFETASDALALGCLVAMAWNRLPRVAWWLAPLLLGLSVLSGTVFYRTGMLTQDALANLACAVLVVWSVQSPGRVLNSRPAVLVGTLSYSLYLWQQPFLDRYTDAWYTSFPLNLVLAVVCAVASYRLVEQPARRWRTHSWARHGVTTVSEST